MASTHGPTPPRGQIEQPEKKRRPGDARSQHQGQDQQTNLGEGCNVHADQRYQQSGSGHHDGVPPSPLALLPPPLVSDMVLRKTLAGLRTDASHALSAPEIESSTAVRLLPHFRRQHCRRKNVDFTRCFMSQAFPALITGLPRRLPCLLALDPARRPIHEVNATTQPQRRAPGRLRRRRKPAPQNAAPLSLGPRAGASNAALPSHALRGTTIGLPAR